MGALTFHKSIVLISNATIKQTFVLQRHIGDYRFRSIILVRGSKRYRKKTSAFGYCTILQWRAINRAMYYLVEAATMNLS